MKPRIDIDDPKIKGMIDAINAKVEFALQLSRKLANSVRPIFIYTTENSQPTQAGSCVILNIENQYFLLSASHVFDGMEEMQVAVGMGDWIYRLGGERYSTLKGASGTHSDDPVDATVFHVVSEVPQEMRESAIGVEDLDFGFLDEPNSLHSAAGFRSKRSRVKRGSMHSYQEHYHSVELSEHDYHHYGLDRVQHIALAHEKLVLVRGRWQQSPIPRGMSGGAVFRFSGISSNPLVPASDRAAPKLTGVVVSYRKGKLGTVPLLIGTRVGFHLGLILHYQPELKAWIDAR